MTKLFALVIAITLSAVTVLSDFFVKKASLEKNIWNKWLLLGGIVYGLTAIGWVFVMRTLKLSTVGAVYGVSCITILALLSVIIFREKISLIEVFGIIMGIASISILYKYA